MENISFSWFAFRSFADEFGTAIEGDINLLQIAILFNIIFANIQLTQWHMVCVYAPPGILHQELPKGRCGLGYRGPCCDLGTGHLALV